MPNPGSSASHPCRPPRTYTASSRDLFSTIAADDRLSYSPRRGPPLSFCTQPWSVIDSCIRGFFSRNIFDFLRRLLRAISPRAQRPAQHRVAVVRHLALLHMEPQKIAEKDGVAIDVKSIPRAPNARLVWTSSLVVMPPKCAPTPRAVSHSASASTSPPIDGLPRCALTSCLLYAGIYGDRSSKSRRTT